MGAAERRRLREALRRTSEAKVFRRAQAILLAASGVAIDQIVQITARSRRSIHRWIARYRRCPDPAVLRDAPRTGRPRAAEAITDRRILAALRADPLRLGYATTIWTVALLAHHLSARYGCPISARTLRRRMKALGLHWKRPRYVYATKAPHRAQKKGRLSAA
jgi:transposase